MDAHPVRTARTEGNATVKSRTTANLPGRPRPPRPGTFIVGAAALVTLTATACTQSGLPIPAVTPTRPASAAPAAAPSIPAPPVATATAAPSTSPSSATTPTPTSAPSGTGGDLQSQYVATIRRVLPSVVQITTDSGLGSGVLFDNKGDIVTNDHVVGAATTFQVSTANNAATSNATLVGSYPADDLAVIKLSRPAGLRPATFGDSSRLQVGDIVLAMGNPLGLSGSVTSGIVSALGRTITEPAETDSPGATLPDVIQTSADINPGNSGGALVDLAGDVIGIPTLAATDQQIGGSAPGIGFAISSNIAKDIAEQLIAHGKVTNSHRAALGIEATGITDTSGNPAGVAITSLTTGGAAARAGLQPGDVITAVDHHPTLSTQDLSTELATLQPGQKIPITIGRAGTTRTLTLTLGSLPG